MRPAILRKFEAGSFKFGTDIPQTDREFTNYSSKISRYCFYTNKTFWKFQ